ncbi:hypothetical protein CBER1_07219 [Cercospora berteroae]|uniref:Uncharacterized protein n=1 Tax=Cercospora berteroae TaxID=357750 RepID=A0A2S6CMB1_9PEZI|nr:hypothetical protein CBER1_07219 [Cercospora berteroae]
MLATEQDLIKMGKNISTAVRCIGQKIREGQSAPFFDFHVEQMCVRWEEFERLTTRAATPDEDVKDMMEDTRKSKGAFQRPTPAAGLDVFTKNHEWLVMVQEQGGNLTGDHED